MKKSILTRVLAALGGVTLWLLGLCALAETFFHVPVTAWLGQLLNAGTPLAVLATLLLAIALCAFGVCCLMMLSTKRAVKRTGFVMQKGENGAIGVSVKSIEGLVQTCVRQHEVVASAEISVVERRDGIVILLSIQEAAGVNIPLAVGALQRQIKQYVTDCTGVDVREVRVMVENTEDDAGESPYAVKNPVLPAMVHAAAEVQYAAPVMEAVEPAPVEEPAVEEAPNEELPAAEEAPYVEETAAAPAVSMPVAPPVMPVMPEIPEEEDDRPLHQRLFGTEEQPVFVPAPPELVIEPVAEETVEEAIQAAEEVIEESPVAEKIDANAVLEVIEAIAREEEIPLEDDAGIEEESAVEEYEVPAGDDEENREESFT